MFEKTTGLDTEHLIYLETGCSMWRQWRFFWSNRSAID